jgi:phosphoglycerate dehydrogenase-like enzyme
MAFVKKIGTVEWLPATFQGVVLGGKNLGIVGLGPSGADMACLAAGVGMGLLGWTRTATAGPVRYGLRLVALDQRFARADVVILHPSLGPQTERIISRTW